MAQQMLALSVQCNKQQQMVGMMAKAIEAMKGESDHIDESLDKVCQMNYQAFGINRHNNELSQVFTQDVEASQLQNPEH